SCITSIIRGITANLVPGQKNFSSAPGLRAGRVRKTLLPLFIELLRFSEIQQGQIRQTAFVPNAGLRAGKGKSL
ncbi:MAG: hypothetical protein J7M32_02845, partial [Deltaproteobacteria bacterium]|nr:hypothetical protein [Deltaproteobacteria bacterium]